MEETTHGIYSVSYPGGGKAVRLTLSDFLVKHAEIGDEDSQHQICKQYKAASGYQHHVSWFTLRGYMARVQAAPPKMKS